MPLLYLTLDPERPAREDRKATIDTLISAEIGRVWAEFGPLMADRAAFLANVAPAFAHDEVSRYHCGGDDHRFPYSAYAVALMQERAALAALPDGTVQAACPQCGRPHPALWTVRRALADTCGHFPVFRLNGMERVIDPTLPTEVSALPRDAAPVLPDDAARLWHSTAHYFGQTADQGMILRETIATLNAGTA
jgi:hypothetical protein